MPSLSALYRAWRLARYRRWVRYGLRLSVGVIAGAPTADSRDKQAEFQGLMRDAQLRR